jgi:radical SAM protein with 4Fe4S-binding SPASM domain
VTTPRHVASPAFHFLANRATGKAYVISRVGDCSVVNLDAMALLLDDEGAWQADPDYAAFLAQAQAMRWLVPAPAPVRACRREVDRRHHLLRVQYELNLRCNLRCEHCYCSSSPEAPAGRDTAFARRLIEEAAALGAIWFDFTGGEPMARPDLLELSALVRDLGMVPGLFTNGTLITPRRAAALRDAGIGEVQTSLDARTPALHDAIRGKAGAFARTVRGIRALQEAGLPVSVTVCLNRRNAHEVDALVTFLRDELGVPFRLDRVIPTGRTLAHEAPLALANHEYFALVRRHAIDGQLPAGKACDGPGRADRGHVEPACGVGASYLFVKHDGRAVLCPTMTEAESPDFAHADLDRWSLAEAWERHPTFQAFRGMQCENASVCPTGARCRGGCRSNAYLLHGSVTSPDEASCNLHKNAEATYRPFLAEYERLRAEGQLPARAPTVPARRRLPVLGGARP